MANPHSQGRFLLAIAWAAWLSTAAGCHVWLPSGHPPLDRRDPTLEQPAPPGIAPPRELQQVSLPAYRVEPPDVIQIEVAKVVPLPPYRLEVFDMVQIDVAGTFMDQPINNIYMVEADGTVNLGPSYGKTRIVGMTIEEATTALGKHLRQTLKQPEVSLRLAQATGVQPVSGDYLVGPDGTINLRHYGQVYVTGMTLAEVKVAVEKHLSQFLDSPDVAVDVVAYNSKVFYIVTQGAGTGDNIVRVPITGNETVLDAISQIEGLSPVSSKEVWIARPAPQGFGCEQILPVDWNAITQGASTATNYQILPGDRVFIAEDHTIALTNFVSKIIGPFERVMGFSSLSASTIRSFNSMNQPYGRY
jgi:polysaccharide export outer membrane protein